MSLRNALTAALKSNKVPVYILGHVGVTEKIVPAAALLPGMVVGKPVIE